MAQDDIVHSRQRPHREDPQAVLPSAICARPIGNANWTCSLAPLCEWKNLNEVIHKGLVVTNENIGPDSVSSCLLLNCLCLSTPHGHLLSPHCLTKLQDFCEKDWTLFTKKGRVVFPFVAE